MSDQIGLVETQFRGYLNLVYKAPQALSRAQVSQLRQAFFAGATMYQGMMLGNLTDDKTVTPEDEEAAQRIFNAYATELEEFAERCASGMAPARGQA